MSEAILGLSAYYHDSAAALLVDGEVVAAAQEERFSRKKHDPSFPREAARYVLNEGGYNLSELSAVAFYEKPWLKFERLLETYHALAPKGLESFLAALPVWIKEKLFMRQILERELARLGDGSPPLFFPEHHISHAAGAFFPSPFAEAAVLTVDGVGEWATVAIGHGQDNRLSLLRELEFPHSLGLLYSAFTYYCGFKVNSGEYKLMGLAPYGKVHNELTKRFSRLIRAELVDLKEDGSFLLNMDYFNFAGGLSMCRDACWEKLFGVRKRVPETELLPPYMALAYAVQELTEEIILRLAGTAKALTGSRHLVLAGGVALNCTANGRLLRSGVFDKLWVQPAASDAGGALGAAYAAWHIGKNRERKNNSGADAMSGASLGPSFSREEIIQTARRLKAAYHEYEDFERLCREAAELLAQGKIIGWFQGRMEYGPRALGGRSILADPRDPQMQQRLNLRIKFREGFRPFAPAVLAEDLTEYFELTEPSPYMLLTAPVKTSRRLAPPPDEERMALAERTAYPRSDIPAVTHVDYSARIQTVTRAGNEKFYSLLQAFKRLTGYGVLVNTSFNVRGEPIVRSPEDALRCFLHTGMDFLIIENFLFIKTEQPAG